jgi:shikimate kinase
MTYYHVILVGLSGSGKSTIGPRLARRLDLPFVDTDRSVVARVGKPIDEIFATAGEPTFRAFERAAVREAVAGPRAVISTGAGAPVDLANRALLWDGNAVVWLDAPLDVLVTRLGRSDRPGRERRPLLSDDVAARLPSLLEARRPIYESAHVRVGTGAARPTVVVSEILRRINPTQSHVRRRVARGGGTRSAGTPPFTRRGWPSVEGGVS